jgi:hypothetical protein
LGLPAAGVDAQLHEIARALLGGDDDAAQPASAMRSIERDIDG